MKKAIGLLTLLILCNCACFTYADTISVLLPQFSDKTGPVTEDIDLETVFTDIEWVSMKISGYATPGYGQGDGVERPFWETYTIPAEIEAYMSYPDLGYFLAKSDEVNGTFEVEIVFNKKYYANWNVLFDGIHDLSLYTSSISVIGGNTIQQPSITFYNVTMSVGGTIDSSVHEIISDEDRIYIQELTELVSNWLQEGSAPNLDGDLNLDGKVDMTDFAMLADTWLNETTE